MACGGDGTIYGSPPGSSDKIPVAECPTCSNTRYTGLLAPRDVNKWYCESLGQFIERGDWCYFHALAHWIAPSPERIWKFPA